MFWNAQEQASSPRTVQEPGFLEMIIVGTSPSSLALPHDLSQQVQVLYEE